jgi:hypothetical protein
MRARCLRPAHKSYDYYGGRGIKFCERWDSFENFLADMGERPAGMTLDRIDSDGHYGPENCRWSPPLAQGRNRRGIQKITVDGMELGMSEWAERLGVKTGVIFYRIRAGWDPKHAVTTPLMSPALPKYAGKRGPL